jgi:DNA repair exonuclease SbcCD ATPase subunit
MNEIVAANTVPVECVRAFIEKEFEIQETRLKKTQALLNSTQSEIDMAESAIKQFLEPYSFCYGGHSPFLCTHHPSDSACPECKRKHDSVLSERYERLCSKARLRAKDEYDDVRDLLAGSIFATSSDIVDTQKAIAEVTDLQQLLKPT